MMRGFDEIMFEVRVNMMQDTINRFEKYLDQSEEENISYPFICEAIVANQKITEQDDEVPEVRGTRRPMNRAERRKKTAYAKNRRKALAKFADDEIRTNSGKVVNTGYRSYEKGAKVYTRKGRVPRDKFTEAPYDPWGTTEEDNEYDLLLDFTDENGEYIGGYYDNRLNRFIYYEDDDYYYEDDDYYYEDDDYYYEDDYQEEIQDLKDYAHQLEHEVEKLYGFIKEYNLGKLFDQWEKSHN